eukprot:TRINITY_DN64179_c0_g1_i2.p1 TRINITY_DN64179_c0_g1~~TRINITY_DN64179_c0_g1_i2.p1  ORF type:complete len:1057 (-),score=76.24 TRINITY_DN64179_c0_g1_i2:98-3268(-)
MGCCACTRKHAAVIDSSTQYRPLSAKSQEELTEAFQNEAHELKQQYKKKLGSAYKNIATALLSSTNKGVFGVYYRKLLLHMKKRKANRQAMQVLLSSTSRGLRLVYYNKLVQFHHAIATRQKYERQMTKRKLRQQLIAMEVLLSNVQRGQALVYWRKLCMFRLKRQRARKAAQLLEARTTSTILAPKFRKWMKLLERRKRSRLAMETLLAATNRGKMMVAYFTWTRVVYRLKMKKRNRPISKYERGTSVGTLLEAALEEFGGGPPTITPVYTPEGWEGAGTRGSTPRGAGLALDEPSFSDDASLGSRDELFRMKLKAAEAMLKQTTIGTIRVFYNKLARFHHKRTRNRQLSQSLARTTERGIINLYYKKWCRFRERRDLQQKGLETILRGNQGGLISVYYHKWTKWHNLHVVSRANALLEERNRQLAKLMAEKRGQTMVALDTLMGKNEMRIMYKFYTKWTALLTKRARQRKIAETLLSSTTRGLLTVYYIKLAQFAGVGGAVANMEKEQFLYHKELREKRMALQRQTAESLLSQTVKGLLTVYYHRWFRWQTRRHRNRQITESMTAHSDFLVAAKYFSKLQQFRVKRKRAMKSCEVLLQSTTRGKMLVAYQRWFTFLKRRKRSREVCGSLQRSTERGLATAYFKKLRSWASESQLIKKYNDALKEHKNRIGHTLMGMTERGLLQLYYRKLAVHSQWTRAQRAHGALHDWDQMSRKMKEEHHAKCQEYELRLKSMKAAWDSEVTEYKSTVRHKDSKLAEQKLTLTNLEESHVTCQTELINTATALEKKTAEYNKTAHEAREAKNELAMVLKDLDRQTIETNRTKALLASKTAEAQRTSEELVSKVRAFQQARVMDDTESTGLRGQLTEKEKTITAMEQDAIAIQNRLNAAENEKASLVAAIESMKPQKTEAAVQSTEGDASLVPLPGEKAKVQLYLITEAKTEMELEESNSVNFADVGKRLNIKMYLPIGVPSPKSVQFIVNGSPRGAPIDAPPYYLMGHNGIWKPDVGQCYIKAELYTQPQGEGVMYEYGHAIISFYEGASNRSVLHQQLMKKKK